MLPLGHSAILLTCIKLWLVLKLIFALFESGRFRQVLLFIIFCLIFQVLQRGATESPTKPKGRPKKDSYDDPSGVQEADKDNSDYAGSDSDNSRDEFASLNNSINCDGHRLFVSRGLPVSETIT